MPPEDVKKYKQRDYQYLEELFDTKLKPITDLQQEHHKTLHGIDFRSGLVKDVNDIKISTTIGKWISGVCITLMGIFWFKK